MKLKIVTWPMRKGIMYATSQWGARLGGMILYPSMYLLGIPYVIYWTPVCVFTHHVAIQQQKICLRYEINKQLTPSHPYKYASFSSLTFFSVIFNSEDNYVELHTKYPGIMWSLFNFGQIIVPLDQQLINTNSPIKLKQTSHSFTISIPHNYLNSPYSEKLIDIVNVRKRNFRYNMSSLIGCFLLYKYAEYADIIPYYALEAGIITSVILKPYCLNIYEELKGSIRNKKINEIVCPEMIDSQLHNLNIDGCYCYVSLFGELVITNSWKQLLAGGRRFFLFN